MSKADYKIEGTVPRELLVSEVRKAARQFAMQFFHFSKVLYDQFGLEKTKDIVRQTVFELAVDRSDQLREKALAQGLKADSVKDFMSVIDLPFTGWIPEWGEDHCPYAEVWRTYFDKYPWFREIAPFYCDVIDTTTIENFSKCLSHRITQNVILEGTCCKREYFESDKVKRGEYTYGKKKKTKNKKRFTWVNLAQLLTVAALLLWMQWAVYSGRVLTIFVASPTSIVEEGIKIITDGTLWPHLLLTIQEALAGYLSAVVVGIAVGLLWTLFPVSEKYMNVFCSAIMAVPKVAILPLLILWFGIGFQSKAFLVFLFSVFTILYNTVTGAKECKKEYLKVARVFRANRFQTVFLVIIPAALPSIFNGLKLAAATALTGVLFSEMQSARAGLGYLLTESQNLLNTPRMFFLIILITLLSVGAVKLIDAIEYAISYRWRHV